VVSELRKVFSDCSIAVAFCLWRKDYLDILNDKPSIYGSPNEQQKQSENGSVSWNSWNRFRFGVCIPFCSDFEKSKE